MKKQTQIKAWRDYKFGMFIHYGLYSVIGRINEWAMFHEPIDRDDYRETMKEFTAERFDGKYYADLAKRMGMKYMVFTTRRHDGFALYDGGEDTHLAHGINLNKYEPSRERSDNYKTNPAHSRVLGRES